MKTEGRRLFLLADSEDPILYKPEKWTNGSMKWMKTEKLMDNDQRKVLMAWTMKIVINVIMVFEENDNDERRT